MKNDKWLVVQTTNQSIFNRSIQQSTMVCGNEKVEQHTYNGLQNIDIRRWCVYCLIGEEGISNNYTKETNDIKRNRKEYTLSKWERRKGSRLRMRIRNTLE